MSTNIQDDGKGVLSQNKYIEESGIWTATIPVDLLEAGTEYGTNLDGRRTDEECDSNAEAGHLGEQAVKAYLRLLHYEVEDYDGCEADLVVDTYDGGRTIEVKARDRATSPYSDLLVRAHDEDFNHVYDTREQDPVWHCDYYFHTVVDEARETVHIIGYVTDEELQERGNWDYETEMLYTDCRSLCVGWTEVNPIDQFNIFN